MNWKTRSGAQGSNYQKYGYTLGQYLAWLGDHTHGVAFNTRTLLDGFKDNSSLFFIDGLMDTSAFTSILQDAAKAIKRPFKDDNHFIDLWLEYVQSEPVLKGFYNRYKLPGTAAIYKERGIEPVVLSAAKDKQKTKAYYKKNTLMTFIQELRTEEKKYAWLVVPVPYWNVYPAWVLGPNESEELAGTKRDKNKHIKRRRANMYIEGNTADDPQRESTYVQFTLAVTEEESFVGYYLLDFGETVIYILPQPAAPKYTIDYAGKVITVDMPEQSQAMKDGYMAGFRVTFVPLEGERKGEKEEVMFWKGAKDEWTSSWSGISSGKPVLTVGASLHKFVEDDKDIPFQVSVCEFKVPDKESDYADYFYGPESETEEPEEAQEWFSSYASYSYVKDVAYKSDGSAYDPNEVSDVKYERRHSLTFRSDGTVYRTDPDRSRRDIGTYKIVGNEIEIVDFEGRTTFKCYLKNNNEILVLYYPGSANYETHYQKF
jgi:hypothetical protein